MTSQYETVANGLFKAFKAYSLQVEVRELRTADHQIYGLNDGCRGHFSDSKLKEYLIVSDGSILGTLKFHCYCYDGSERIGFVTYAGLYPVNTNGQGLKFSNVWLHASERPSVMTMQEFLASKVLSDNAPELYRYDYFLDRGFPLAACEKNSYEVQRMKGRRAIED